jgi:hypothetical protein
LLEAATNILLVFDMSATMAMEGGRVQLEQSNIHLALTMAKMAKEGYSQATIEEMKYLIEQSCAKVQEEKKWGIEFPVHKIVKAAIQRHTAMLRQNYKSDCVPCPIDTTMNP